MVCLGLKPGVAGWKVKTNPLSYGGTLLLINCLFKIIDSAFAKSKYDKIDVIIRTTIESYISCCSFFPQKIAHFSHSFHLSVQWKTFVKKFLFKIPASFIATASKEKERERDLPTFVIFIFYPFFFIIINEKKEIFHFNLASGDVASPSLSHTQYTHSLSLFL